MTNQMRILDKLKIATDFADNPGARDRADGLNSGAEFLEDLLLPKFDKAVRESYKLQIDLDDLWGFPSSFVSGAFGALSMQKGADLVLKHLELVAENSPDRIDKVIKEIMNPTRKREYA